MAEVGLVTKDRDAPYRVLARKYRPADFSALIGQEPVVRTLTNAFGSGRIAQAWMLTGVRGVGKTTTARILARALNYRTAETDAPSVDLAVPGEHCRAIMEGRHPDVIEMDAASHTGVDNMRDLLEQVRYAPVAARYKVYIIDEVHMLSGGAFNAMLKTLEEPPPHVKFIFATTEIRKVPITILSRCQRFDLRRVEPGLLASHLAGVAEKEGIVAEVDALALIARAAEGSVRDALSILDQAIAHGGGAVNGQAVRDMLGLADRARVIDLFENLMKGDAGAALAEFRAQYDAGADPLAVLTDLAEFTHLVTRFKVVGPVSDLALSPDERARGAELAETLSMSVLSRAWQMLLKGLGEVGSAPRPVAAAEMVLIRIAHAAHLPTLDEALKRLENGAPASSAAGAPAGGAARPAPAPVAVRPAFVAPASPAAGEPALTASGAGANRASALRMSAPEPAPSAPQPSADAPPAEPEVAVASLGDVVALAERNRDLQFKVLVKRCVRPVRVEPGRLEVSFTADAPPTLATDLSVRLKKWTGRQWLVSVSRTEGGRTLAEEEAQVRETALSDARSDPAVAEILARFPGARIIDVRIPDTAPEPGFAPAASSEAAGAPEVEQDIETDSESEDMP
ncbi:MAG TPA: DNA polymerase III subunit gamma/tau [Mesorhizobium sp.]|jgi:DNA polymerase-3 subunit gamma/tau|nr:DNA polymerase III subunit gamma/tau [Mesorhizobium sp.]